MYIFHLILSIWIVHLDFKHLLTYFKAKYRKIIYRPNRPFNKGGKLAIVKESVNMHIDMYISKYSYVYEVQY